ncbi:MAG: Glutamate racemase 1, partial [Chlamydiae bacterium]|nr:Glutamate racemase 1 [Chlamydiota bacterium]
MIGIFDSGLGGLTVMKELIKALPNEDIIYFGDTARVPYGNKSAETVIRYSMEISQFLIEHEIKLLVVACNTASAYALNHIQNEVDIPVVGVIDPGAFRAVMITENQNLAVLGTTATINSGAYQSAILSYCPGAEVWTIPCPLFVPLVEENFLYHEATKLIIREYLSPLQDKQIDTVLLGCTHYPMMKTLIQEELGAHVNIVDSASSCAQKVSDLLNDENLLNEKRSSEYRFYVSDDPVKFQQAGSQFLGLPIGLVTHVDELTTPKEVKS